MPSETPEAAGYTWPHGGPGLAKYERMWTTEKDEWCLRSDGSGDYVPERGDMLFVIGDDEVARLVVAKMLAAGVRVVGDGDG